MADRAMALMVLGAASGIDSVPGMNPFAIAVRGGLIVDMAERHLDMVAVRRAMEWGTHV